MQPLCTSQATHVRPCATHLQLKCCRPSAVALLCSHRFLYAACFRLDRRGGLSYLGALHANRIQELSGNLNALARASEAQADEVHLKLPAQILDALLVLLSHDWQIVLHIVELVWAPLCVEDGDQSIQVCVCVGCAGDIITINVVHLYMHKTCSRDPWRSD